jgi:hypothetical protein
VISPCATTGWSAVTSALANATLAGLLAGFMLNGIVVLLSRQPEPGQRVGYLQGASLLFAAFVTLGLDAFLFGLVSGDQTRIACRRAWSEAMFAAGLLGLGTVAVVVSIVFLLGVFFARAAEAAEARTGAVVPDPLNAHYPAAGLAEGTGWPGQKAAQPVQSAADRLALQSNHLLILLCNLLRPSVAVLVEGLLFMTGTSYLFAFFKGHPPTWTHVTLWVLSGSDFAVIALFLLVYRWYAKGANRGLFVTIPLLRRVFNPVFDEILKILSPDGVVRALRWTILLSVGYALLSVGFTAVCVSVPVHVWNSSGFTVDAMVVATLVWVLWGSLAPLTALLAPSFGPSTSPEEARSRAQQMRTAAAGDMVD